MPKCNNVSCKYNSSHKCDKKRIEINEEGRCANYEKGFIYYFYYFKLVLAHTNMIPICSLSDDMRICIYYLMKCLPIVFSCDYIRGMLVLRNKETKAILNADDICDMIGSDSIDINALETCIEDFERNGLPKIEEQENKEQEEVDEKEKYTTKEYGWLSPTGIFTPSPWGSHEESARDIIKLHQWIPEFEEWRKQNKDGLSLAVDFLQFVKWYALIHDPSNLGYTVTNTKMLTKHQREFLYGYFKDMGMTLRAESYVEEE